LVESFRQIKSKNELSKIKKAIEITKLAFQYAKTIIRVGVRENELACLLESFIKERGADSFSFDIIVASGQNTSYPHYKTSKKRLKKGEVLLIDMGVNYLGYKSDLTRIFFLDKITPVIRRIYNIVLMAQERAIKNIKPGVPISEIDRTARQFITRQGFGRYFGHSLGHGIGLEVHEDPHISFKNNNLLTENMIFTVEPAIYLPGRLGIRIEDMVLVTPNGAEILSGDIDKSI
jgi:Xaa-Pro aminopeptidase